MLSKELSELIKHKKTMKMKANKLQTIWRHIVDVVIWTIVLVVMYGVVDYLSRW